MGKDISKRIIWISTCVAKPTSSAFYSWWWLCYISKTIANLTILLLVIHIPIKTITFEKFHCCGDALVYCLLQFFCYYFYNCCSYFLHLICFFTFLMSFIVTIYLKSNFSRMVKKVNISYYSVLIKCFLDYFELFHLSSDHLTQ